MAMTNSADAGQVSLPAGYVLVPVERIEHAIDCIRKLHEQKARFVLEQLLAARHIPEAQGVGALREALKDVDVKLEMESYRPDVNRIEHTRKAEAKLRELVRAMLAAQPASDEASPDVRAAFDDLRQRYPVVTAALAVADAVEPQGDGQKVKLKVYSGCIDGQHDLLVAAPSKKAALSALQSAEPTITRYAFDVHFTETWGDTDIAVAMSAPGAVFEGRVLSRSPDDYRRLTPQEEKGA